MSLVLSLFPGIGVLDRAFELEGFCVVRGPDVLWGGDVREFHPPRRVFDGVIGGPPCQSFSSLANLVRAKGLETRFGNLIPEFERCVQEAAPEWWLMENVPRSPIPAVLGYQAVSFVLDNADVAGEDGFGQEQMRARRWTFGLRGVRGVSLAKLIPRAALRLPRAAPAVTADARDTPVRHGGTKGKVKRVLQEAVSGAHRGASRPKSSRGERRTLPEMLRLQGLPEDFLEHSPFTMEAKRRVIGNAVPMAMGRAMARAVREAIASSSEASSRS